MKDLIVFIKRINVYQITLKLFDVSINNYLLSESIRRSRNRIVESVAIHAMRNTPETTNNLTRRYISIC